MSSAKLELAPAVPLSPATGGSRPPAWLGPALRWLLRLGSLVACVLVWEFAAASRLNLGLVTFANVPPPSEVGPAIWKLVSSPKFSNHVGASLTRVFSGFFAAALAGVLLGLLVGRSRRLEDVVMPPLEALRPIPAVSWIPLAILMFPSSELSMIFITFIGALFPVLLNTVHGVHAVDGRLVAAARSLGAGRIAVLREVVLPGAAPSIVTGLTIGMGTSWFCLVTAEMIAGQYGIGYYTWESYTLQNYADIVVGMVFIGLFGMASSAALRRLGALATPWYRLREKQS
ncbi:ABC transporter permease [Pseudothauera nasutitermitis]|uniref:ABC transporter permease n=1 Tax=Pseudothauera nasutitermitis TaxID=2565930 RepID=A0A4S4B8P4_9RHOO|nr:ABC transporter permease [Pseudothauera nasutitermitis]THF67363.1 ABC transporter permease [Pseudothauera nasutitermitis]